MEARNPTVTSNGMFQSSPGPVGRVQHLAVGNIAGQISVSILTRPVGRVQLPYPFFLLVFREPPQPWQGVSTFCST